MNQSGAQKIGAQRSEGRTPEQPWRALGPGLFGLHAGKTKVRGLHEGMVLALLAREDWREIFEILMSASEILKV